MIAAKASRPVGPGAEGERGFRRQLRERGIVGRHIGRIGDDHVEALAGHRLEPGAAAPVDVRQSEARAHSAAATPSAAGETSTPVIRARGRSEAIARAMAPLPVPRSSTDARRSRGQALQRQVRPETSVSGRGTSTAGVTSSSSDQNSRVPGQVGDRRARRRGVRSGGEALLGIRPRRLVAARDQAGARQVRGFCRAAIRRRAAASRCAPISDARAARCERRRRPCSWASFDLLRQFFGLVFLIQRARPVRRGCRS